MLVDFWTYSCINCIRTLPYLRGYWDKYGPEDGQTLQDAPFVILGVHTPEFVFEKSEANVQDAIERHDLQYPVVQDNDYKIWRSFANRYWPAKYLIDAEGTIRYTHFGEGAYDETDERIAELLREIGVSVEGDVIGAGVGGGSVSGQSPETYLGARSWPALANGPAQPTDDSVTYAAPGSLALHKYALVGTWQLIDDERQTLRSDTGEIRMHFKAGEVNLVMGMEPGSAPSTAQVLIDGNAIKSFSIDRHDLFSLWKGDFGEHDLVLKITGPGAQGYAFTFGG